MKGQLQLDREDQPPAASHPGGAQGQSAQGRIQGQERSGRNDAAAGTVSADRAAFVGLSGSPDGDAIRSWGAAAAKEIRGSRTESALVLVPAELYGGANGCSTVQAAQALAEGLLLGAYERIKTAGEAAKKSTLSAEIAVRLQGEVSPEQQAEWRKELRLGRMTANAVIEARNLVHLPGSELTPEVLAEYAEQLASECDLDCEVLDEFTAHELGMGGLLGVGKGSMHPPRMIVLHYEGDPGNNEKWGLIGKGITFDTGGYSLKQAPGMQDMICDMGGAAAVLGAMRIIGTLKPKTNIVAVIPSAENMISDRAYKPGDVLTMMNGTTVEIVNTDAEGRSGAGRRDDDRDQARSDTPGGCSYAHWCCCRGSGRGGYRHYG